MKRYSKYLASAIILLTILTGMVSASKPKAAEVVTIQTNAVCEACKARIEKALKGADGVVSANLNLDNKKIKVKYNPDKTTPDQIRTVIASTGYDADNVKRNTEAFNSLPKCCQGAGTCEHK